MRKLQLIVFWSMIIAGVYLWLFRSGPALPEFDHGGLDPLVAGVLRNCEQVVRKHPRSGDAWGQLGAAYLVYDIKEQARQCFEHAEQFDKVDARWPYFHAIALLPDHEEDSVELFRRAVALDRDKTPALRLRLAEVLGQQKKYDEAEQEFQHVLTVTPDESIAELGLARLAIARGNLDQSVQHLTASATSPFTARAANQLLISVQERLGNQDEAQVAREKLKSLPADKRMPDPFVKQASALRAGLKAWVQYSVLLLRQGRVKEALSLADRAVTEYPESAEAWILMARVQLADKNGEKAREAADKAAELAADDVESHMQLGVVHLFQKSADSAIASFQRAIQLDGKLSEAHHNLALAYTAKDDWANAESSFREATRLNPNLLDSHIGLAESLARQSKLEEASTVARAALRISPNDPRTHQIVSKYQLDAADETP